MYEAEHIQHVLVVLAGSRMIELLELMINEDCC